LVSNDITVPTNDVYISSIRIDYIAQKAGTFNIYCSRDDGEWTLLKTVTITEILKHKIARIQKVIHARRLKFKITSESGLFEITHYEIKVYPSGASTK
jgi:5-methylcytosine-specific restriction endonuclease McrA